MSPRTRRLIPVAGAPAPLKAGVPARVKAGASAPLKAGASAPLKAGASAPLKACVPASLKACVLTLLTACVLTSLSACGEPPRPLPTSPPYATASAPSSAASSFGLPPAPLPPTAAGYPTYQANPTYATPPAVPTQPVTTATTPSPTPAHAARCTGQPTGAEILAKITGMQGIPSAPLRVFEGPFCSGTWSFTTVEVSGMSEDQVDPLMVIATGRGSTLAVLAAGSDVCTDPVRLGAPPGIRVLACGS